jgi:hypothetical protein
MNKYWNKLLGVLSLLQIMVVWHAYLLGFIHMWDQSHYWNVKEFLLFSFDSLSLHKINNTSSSSFLSDSIRFSWYMNTLLYKLCNFLKIEVFWDKTASWFTKWHYLIPENLNPQHYCPQNLKSCHVISHLLFISNLSTSNPSSFNFCLSNMNTTF